MYLSSLVLNLLFNLQKKIYHTIFSQRKLFLHFFYPPIQESCQPQVGFFARTFLCKSLIINRLRGGGPQRNSLLKQGVKCQFLFAIDAICGIVYIVLIQQVRAKRLKGKNVYNCCMFGSVLLAYIREVSRIKILIAPHPLARVGFFFVDFFLDLWNIYSMKSIVYSQTSGIDTNSLVDFLNQNALTGFLFLRHCKTGANTCATSKDSICSICRMRLNELCLQRRAKNLDRFLQIN